MPQAATQRESGQHGTEQALDRDTSGAARARARARTSQPRPGTGGRAAPARRRIRARADQDADPLARHSGRRVEPGQVPRPRPQGHSPAAQLCGRDALVPRPAHRQHTPAPGIPRRAHHPRCPVPSSGGAAAPSGGRARGVDFSDRPPGDLRPQRRGRRHAGGEPRLHQLAGRTHAAHGPDAAGQGDHGMDLRAQQQERSRGPGEQDPSGRGARQPGHARSADGPARRAGSRGRRPRGTQPHRTRDPRHPCTGLHRRPGKSGSGQPHAAQAQHRAGIGAYRARTRIGKGGAGRGAPVRARAAPRPPAAGRSDPGPADPGCTHGRQRHGRRTSQHWARRLRCRAKRRASCSGSRRSASPT